MNSKGWMICSWGHEDKDIVIEEDGEQEKYQAGST
jgi:hypothetical protein